MLRWRWVLLLWIVGGLMTGYGVLVELRLREAMGGAFKSFLAGVFFSGKIAHYRWLSQGCVIVGPAVMLLAFLLRRNWEPAREAAWLEERAAKRSTKAERLRHRSSRIAVDDPDRAELIAAKATRVEQRAERLRRKARRKLERS